MVHYLPLRWRRPWGIFQGTVTEGLCFVEPLRQVMHVLNGFVWGPYMLGLLVGTGVFLTVVLRFINIRRLWYALRLVTRRGARDGVEGDISPFEALTTALSATVGTGNIAGVATAISLGGPGAVFWMWVCAFFGMATKYSETVLAVTYRRHLPDGTMCGGPMQYLSRGLGLRWLGSLFALCGAVAAMGIGDMVQSNSVALAMREAFGVRPQVTGVVLCLLTAAVIIGGIRRIGSVTATMVPVMGVFYLGFGLLILFLHAGQLPAVVQLIFSHAFTPCAAGGGFAGAAVSQALRYGIARGVFSNEAGLGSAPIAHAAARTDSPVSQGLISMTEVFIDTLVICSTTAFVILLSPEVWQSGLDSSRLTAHAFETFLPGLGSLVVALSLAVFAYSTLIGWSYYGEECIEYLLGMHARGPYRVAFCALIVVGALLKVDLVWNFSDTMNGCMAIPNLIGLLGLSGVVYRQTRSYFRSS